MLTWDKYVRVISDMSIAQVKTSTLGKWNHSSDKIEQFNHSSDKVEHLHHSLQGLVFVLSNEHLETNWVTKEY